MPASLCLLGFCLLNVSHFLARFERISRRGEKIIITSVVLENLSLCLVVSRTEL